MNKTTPQPEEEKKLPTIFNESDTFVSVKLLLRAATEGRPDAVAELTRRGIFVPEFESAKRRRRWIEDQQKAWLRARHVARFIPGKTVNRRGGREPLHVWPDGSMRRTMPTLPSGQIQ